jgi:hypothetical protein
MIATMENAAKALEIAGGVLISLIVLALLVAGYNSWSNLKKVEQGVESERQATDFNQSYESYNRNDVYGSEIFSLANLVINYNNKEKDEKGYKELNITITINTNGEYFKKGTYTQEQITQVYNKLSDVIASKNVTIKNKKLSYWASSSTEVKETFTDKTNPTYAQMRTYISEYNKLTTEQKDMARSTFKCTNVEYDDNTNRIVKMTFVQN